MPQHLCWSYYYDPRCLRGSSSSLAMFCDPTVMILAIKDIGSGKKGFANASDYLETWDDSDSITAVNAHKRFETFTKMVA